MSAYSRVAGNEEADKWAKQATEEPDARGGGGMDGLYGRIREAASAASPIFSQLEAGDFGKEVGRGADMVEE